MGWHCAYSTMLPNHRVGVDVGSFLLALARKSCSTSPFFFPRPHASFSLSLRGWPVLAASMHRAGTHKGRIGRLRAMAIIPARLRTAHHWFSYFSHSPDTGQTDADAGRACVVSLTVRACGRSLRGGADRARATRITRAGTLGALRALGDRLGASCESRRQSACSGRAGGEEKNRVKRRGVGGGDWSPSIRQ